LRCTGHYYEESLSSVDVSRTNKYMITGDTQGITRTWCLDKLATCCTVHDDGRHVDGCITSLSKWRTHTAAVSSVSVMLDNEELFLTSGLDMKVAMWDVHGRHVGTFGEVRLAMRPPFPH
jgi:WD40 repeat protein